MIGTGKLMTCVSKTSDLAKKRSVSMEELLNYPIIIFAPNGHPTNLTTYFIDLYKPKDFPLNIPFLLGSFSLVAQYISNNLGVGFMVSTINMNIFVNNFSDNIETINIKENTDTHLLLLGSEKTFNSPMVQEFIKLLPLKFPQTT